KITWKNKTISTVNYYIANKNTRKISTLYLPCIAVHILSTDRTAQLDLIKPLKWQLLVQEKSSLF
ncbi:hypothetical protein, partial [uncultured Nitrosomonas sp.]|uniref:hypothetical protein n=1 Tax=uncultured Nitrosomonas sp. TaxID=156424 RepID=UPI0025CEF9E5